MIPVSSEVFVAPILDNIRAKNLNPIQLRHRAHLHEMNGHPALAELYRDEAEAQEAVIRVQAVRLMREITGSLETCPTCGGLGRIEDNPCWRCG